MADGREYELKYSLDADGAEALARHPLLQGAEPRSARMQATYFDTPGHDLWADGISLRIRESDGRKVQTVKQLGASFIDRDEVEFETDRNTPTVEPIADGALRDRLDRRSIRDSLEPAFTVAVERTTLDLVHGASAIEAAIDRGTITSGGRSLPISEVELELKHGTPTDLFALAGRLVADLPLRASLISKAERGYRLHDGSWGRASKSTPIALKPDMPAAAAFRAIGESCLHDLMLNLAGFEPGCELEIVHRSRVALRRFRAATSLFKPLVADATFAALDRDLRWMWHLMGAARDLDVLQTGVFDPAARDAVTGGAVLAEHMQLRQRDAYGALAEALRSRRWRVALHGLIAWMADGLWLRRGARAESPLRDLVVPRLRKRRRAIVRAGEGLSDLPAQERHALRIAAKKLRYALEFFETTRKIGRGRKAYRHLQEGLEALQEPLGALHDHEAKQALLQAEAEAWAVPGDRDDERAVFAAGLLAASGPNLGDLLHAAEEAYASVKSSKPF